MWGGNGRVWEARGIGGGGGGKEVSDVGMVGRPFPDLGWAGRPAPSVGHIYLSSFST